ncbi:MAG TPA: sugar-binding protein [Marinagarivorans sp.]
MTRPSLIWNMFMLSHHSFSLRCPSALVVVGAIALAGCTAEPVPTESSSSAAPPLSSSSTAESSSISSAQSSSIAASSSEPASSSSVSSAASSAPIIQSNHYDAPKVAQPPVIDGIEDNSWSAARWQKIDVLWLGAQQEYPSPEDYSGRYKAMWDSNYLYLLVDITDDVIFDAHRDPLSSQLHIDDTVEIFIDEDNSGGNHWNNNAANAWAYHVSTYKDVVDFGLSGEPILLNEHIQTEINSQGTRHLWEMRISIYDDQYNFAQGASNTPVTLFAGKTLGFSVCYIDNDNSIPESRYERESMMGSVDTQGHKDDLGYMNADVFGTLTLIE